MRPFDSHWEHVNASKHHIVDRFFDQTVSAEKQCEVFCIEGVPAACMIFTHTPQGSLTAEVFHLNVAILSLFDAGAQMRSSLYKRYPRVNIRHARNRREFLTL